jgi:hypothetical protein
VTFGDLKRLLINVPPGFMKSLLTDVFWPAWEWGPMNMPYLRHLAFAYAQDLTTRDNNKLVKLVTSHSTEHYGETASQWSKSESTAPRTTRLVSYWPPLRMVVVHELRRIHPGKIPGGASQSDREYCALSPLPLSQ